MARLARLSKSGGIPEAAKREFRDAHWVRRVMLVCSLWAGWLMQASAQTVMPEVGRPFLQSYAPRDYRAETQNWAVVQDHRGLLYFGNNDGVLEFDGIHWRLIKVDNGTVARGLAIDSSGRIYVGAKDELGYLAPNRQGTLEYRSLLEHVPQAYRSFWRIEKVITTQGHVWFRGHNVMFQWDGQRMQVHPAQGEWLYAERWAGGLLGYDTQRGLVAYGPKGWRQLPGTLGLVGKRPLAILSENSQGFVMLTRSHGLYEYRNEVLTALTSPLSRYMAEALPYAVCHLPGGKVAIGTLGRGIMTVDLDGTVHHVVDQTNGLPDNYVLALYLDNKEALWVGLNNGIARLEPSSGLSFYDEATGVEGGIVHMIRHKGHVLLASLKGVKQLEASQQRSVAPGLSVMGMNAFKSLPELGIDVWQMLSWEDQLLAATADGLKVVQWRGGLPAVAVVGPSSVLFSLAPHPASDDYLLAGSDDGLFIFQRTASGFQYLGILPGTKGMEARYMHPAGPSSLWVFTQHRGLYKLTFPAGGPHDQVLVTPYGPQKGMPSLVNVNAFLVNGRYVFTTPQGLYRYQDSTDSFVPDGRFNEVLGTGAQWVWHIHQMTDSTVLLHTLPNRRTLLARQGPLGKFYPANLPGLRLQNFEISTTMSDADGTLWLGGNEGLIRFKPSGPSGKASPLPLLIRKITIGKDSVLFGGAFQSASGRVSQYQNRDLAPTLRFADNDLRVEVAGLAFDNPSEVEYRYWLEGLDEGWTGWTNEPYKHYTNLPYHRFTLHVQARDAYGAQSEPVEFRFSILRPWYASAWAYLFYLALGVGGVWGLVRWTSYRLKTDNQRLEGLVGKRTEELADQTKELERTLGELRSAQRQLILNEKLAALGQMIDSVAHELNTPMGVIRSSLVGLQHGSERMAAELPGWLSGLSVADRQFFTTMLEWLRTHRTEPTTRQEREWRRQLGHWFVREKLDVAPETIRCLSELGLQPGAPELLAIVKHSRGVEIVRYLHILGRFEAAVKAISGASMLTDHIIFLLRNYGQSHASTPPEWVDVAHTLNHALDVHRHHFSERIDLKVNLRPAAPIPARADELTQVWNHLITNALHAMPHRGALTITLTPSPNWVVVEVADSGPGIPADVLPYVFDPFFTTKPAGQGTGMGLDLCRRIVTQHGGDITITSSPGHTVVRVQLPVRAAPVQPMPIQLADVTQG